MVESGHFVSRSVRRPYLPTIPGLSRALIPASRHEVYTYKTPAFYTCGLASHTRVYIYTPGAKARQRLAGMPSSAIALALALRARSRRRAAQYCTYCSVLVYRRSYYYCTYIYCCIDDQDHIGCTSAIFIIS